MDKREEDQKQARTAGKFNYDDQFLKRTLSFAISASLVSLCLWCSTGCSLIPQYSLNFCFSTFLFSIFTRTLERKFMFLICNGILAFLAKSSLCNSSVMSVTGDASETNDIVSGEMMPSGKSNTCESHENVILLAAEVDVEQAQTDGYQADDANPEAEEQKVIDLNCKMEDIENDEDSSEEQMQGLEEEEGKDEEGHEGEVLMTEDDGNSEPTTTTTANEEFASADELNRKFEEFIRKMKEEIRIEAQKQVIVV